MFVFFFLRDVSFDYSYNVLYVQLIPYLLLAYFSLRVFFFRFSGLYPHSSSKTSPLLGGVTFSVQFFIVQIHAYKSKSIIKVRKTGRRLVNNIN